jgi:V8-like Glu-specific endopeptidase
MNARPGGAQRALAGLAVAASLSIFLATSLAGAAPARASGVELPSWSAAEAGAFWTPERMRQAQPVEVRERRPGAARASSAPPPSGPEDTNFVQVDDPTAPEFRVNGAIFFAFGLFGYGRCSGTAVRSGNKSVVITAAHCINSGGRHGGWFQGRWAFVPGYRFGQRPFGVFPARWIDTTRQWRISGSENFDVGAAVLGKNQRGELLGEAVGGDKIAWNLKRQQTFDVHGYPAEEPFDGETQRVCRETPFLGHDPESVLFPGPLNLAVACQVTGGASGGGWTIHGDTLNGVTNYGYFDGTTPDFGAYFGKEVARLYGRAVRFK